jgi:carboxypeptidase Q
MLRLRVVSAFVLYAFLLPSVAFAQSAVYQAPKEAIDKIKDEGMKRSQVMQTLSYLTDVIGGRLTNSPNMKRANEWTRDTMAKWGMENAKLVAWGPFGRGWSLKRFSAQVNSPQSFPVIAYPKAWSPGLDKVIPQPTANPKDKKNKNPQPLPPVTTLTSDVVYLDAKTDADLQKYKGQLKGKIVLVSDAREIKADFEGMGIRLTDKDLLEMANSPDPSLIQRPQQQQQPNQAAIQRFFDRFVQSAKRMNFLLEEGAALLIDNSFEGSGGTVFVSGAAVAQEVPTKVEDLFGARRLNAYQKEAEAKMIPQMTMASEDYNRLVRMIGLGEKVQMTVDLAVQYHDDDLMGYNTTAEIPGSDLKDELVMMGGHLDSWHSGTGATDNAAGCAVAMEAARILIASGLKPRRTIRVALWSGEEQGLNGSREYVKQMFGEMKGGTRNFLGMGTPGTLEKGAEYDKLSAYYNLDNGTGKIRGVYLQGNSAVAPIFRTWLIPFGDMGASTLTIRNTGGTDHLSFDAIGLPGFQFIQDEIEYDLRTHHSNQDNYDRIQAEDMKQAATIMAAFVYQTAMMDEKIPRKAPR